jgi:signal transduction histidine kinase/CheY-like chemotaxis protein
VINEAGRENRVLISMPTGRDGELVCSILSRMGISSESVEPQRLPDEIAAGAGTVLVAEEALLDGVLGKLEEALLGQPVWSDLPLIVFSGNTLSAEKLLQALSGKFNATIVERPIRITMLVSAVRGALRARERQYQARDLLAQLKQADQQKDLFLATLSHELRTPLNSILGWIHILRRRNIGGPEVTHALDVIDRNARAQSEMIADILLVSRVITGKVELSMEPVELTSIIAESIDVVRPSADAKNIQISLHTSDYTPSPVEGDTERLQQILLNLLTNAVKFTEENGRIDIILRRVDGSVEIEVKDNGCGIEPRFLPFIFERFRQADSRHTRRVGGLGLGLAIVSHLVELHGGKVEAYSEGWNKGARFVVKLPVMKSERVDTTISPAVNSSSNGNSEQSLSGIQILIVEDDEDSRDMLATILKQHGARVIEAEDVDRGFALFRAERPDILVSDVGLPEQDGYDLIRKIRTLPPIEGGDVPAIALTGYVSLQDQIQTLSAGFQEHLPKPVDTDRLIRLLVELSKTKDRSQTTVGSR